MGILKRMFDRFPKWIFPAGAVAIFANVALLGTGLFLTHHKVVQKQDLQMGGGVALMDLADEKPQEEQQVAEPQPPKDEPQPDVSPDDLLKDIDLNSELQALGNIAGGVSINLGGATDNSARKDLVFQQYELDQAPRAVVKMPPVYPYKAREQGVEGVVEVKILVRDDGSVGDIQIMDSRPKDVFDDAVINAIEKWRFEAGTIGGKKVTSWVVTSLHFKLNQ
jgi:protein TonB